MGYAIFSFHFLDEENKSKGRNTFPVYFLYYSSDCKAKPYWFYFTSLVLLVIAN